MAAGGFKRSRRWRIGLSLEKFKYITSLHRNDGMIVNIVALQTDLDELTHWCGRADGN